MTVSELVIFSRTSKGGLDNVTKPAVNLADELPCIYNKAAVRNIRFMLEFGGAWNANGNRFGARAGVQKGLRGRWDELPALIQLPPANAAHAALPPPDPTAEYHRHLLMTRLVCATRNTNEFRQFVQVANSDANVRTLLLSAAPDLEAGAFLEIAPNDLGAIQMAEQKIQSQAIRSVHESSLGKVRNMRFAILDTLLVI